MKSLILGLLIFLTVPIAGGLPAHNKLVAAQIAAQEQTYFVLETLTIYHPTAGQCDATPLITASNARIDIEKLRRQEIRWMALSRDLLRRWNGEFHYGDTVMLKAGDPAIDGLWVINDNMNKRYKNRGDLLFHSDERKSGIWKNVRLEKWATKEVAI